MKTKLNDFLEKIEKREDAIIEEAICSEEEVDINFKERLFKDVHSQSSLESYISEEADAFANKYLTAEVVFEKRNSLYRDIIEEILSEREGTLTSVKAMDSIYEEAGYRYIFNVGFGMQSQLLAVYSLREAYESLDSLDENILLDSSEYDDFENIDELVESFVNEIINEAESSNDIINIEDFSKNLCEEYFNISF